MAHDMRPPSTASQMMRPYIREEYAHMDNMEKIERQQPEKHEGRKTALGLTAWFTIVLVAMFAAGILYWLL